MQFIIPAETFARIAKAAAEPNDDRYPQLSCVRLEHCDGKTYAVASSPYVMAVEYLGDTTEPDGAVNIAVNNGWSVMLNTYSTAEQLVFDWWPEFAVVTSSDGFGVSAVPDSEMPVNFIRWPQVFAAAKRDKGFLYIEADLFTKLASSSPSGYITFPAVVNNTHEVICRDAIDPNWCGVFIAADRSKKAVAAVRPEWLP